MTTTTLSALWHMVTGAISACNISGPIGMAETMGDAARGGLEMFVQTLAMFSVGIGLMNLFPIPVLDGGHLVFHVWEAITGKPYKPTTQGKNERFHQTLFRWLDAQPLASSLGELQAQVDTFDHIYNTERPHQGLPGRVTPMIAWLATPKADPPRPTDDHPVVRQLRDRQPDPARMPTGLPAGTILRKLTSQGIFTLDNVHYLVDAQRGFQDVLVVQDDNQIMVVDFNGEILLETTRPAPGITYVGNGRSKGAPRHTKTKRNKPSPMS